MSRKPDSIKGFYVYFVEGTCFDCGAEDKVILGWYKGEPSKEILTKIAKSYVKDEVIPFKEDQLMVTNWCIIADSFDGFNKVLFKTEKFTLQEVE